MTQSTNINGRRKQKNIVSISMGKYPRNIYLNLLSVVFNLFAWSLEVAGDLTAVFLKTYNFQLAMHVAIVFSAGLTPIVYIIGGKDFLSRATSSTEKKFYEHFKAFFIGRKEK